MAPEVHQVLTARLLSEERLKSWLICRKSQKDGIRHFPLLFKTVQARQMAPVFKIRVQIPSTYMKSKTCPQVLVTPPLWRSGEQETVGRPRLASQPPGSVSPCLMGNSALAQTHMFSHHTGKYYTIGRENVDNVCLSKGFLLL